MGKTIGSPALDALKPPRIFISFATADGAAWRVGCVNAGESPARPGGARARHLAGHCGAAGRAGLVDADRGGAEVGGARPLGARADAVSVLRSVALQYYLELY
jgi:hypothetical protein